MHDRSAGSRTGRSAADGDGGGRAVSGEDAADAKADDEDVVRAGDWRMIDDYCARPSRSSWTTGDPLRCRARSCGHFHMD